jgi:hypothetical protein
MANTHQVRECRIQTCPTWAPSDESWTYQADWFVSAPISTACGGNGGSASFTAVYGRKHDPRRGSIYSQYPLQSFVGEWCRVIVADPDGDILVGIDTFTAIWYGKISTWEIQPTAANRPNVTVEIGAEHVTAAFLAVACCHSWETPSDNSVDIVPTYIPPVFNAIPYGDKSNLVWDLDGVSVPIFNRSTQLKEDRNLWTYGNALKYLCASARPWIPTQERGGPKFILDPGYPAQLDSAPLPAKSGRGNSVIDIIRSIVNPSIGLVVYFQPDLDGIHVVVKPCASENITLKYLADPDDEEPTILTIDNPYDDDPYDLNITGDATITDVRLRETDDGEDYIQCVGGDDIYGTTIDFSNDEASIVEPALTWEVTDEPSEDGEKPDAFSLFKIKDSWNGLCFDTDDNQNGLWTSYRHTEEGCDGSGNRNETNHPANTHLKFLRNLPWGDDSSAGSRLMMKSFLVNSPTDIDEKGYQFQPIEMGQFRLGKNLADAQELKENYDASLFTTLTVSIVGWHPLLLCWRNTVKIPPRDLPRVRLLQQPRTSVETGQKDAAIGVNEDGGVWVNDEDLYRWSDSYGMDNALSTEAARATKNSKTLTFKVIGSVIPEYDIGDPISTLTFGVEAQEMTIDVRAVVTNISIDTTAAGFGVTYQCLRP